MLAALTPSAASPVWIMRPTTAARVTAALGTASSLPQSLYGLPAILSARTLRRRSRCSPPTRCCFADDGAFDVSISREAAVHMDTVPDSPPDGRDGEREFLPAQHGRCTCGALDELDARRRNQRSST